MFTSFTNVYYFTTIVTTAIGYGSQFTDTTNGRIFLIIFALVAVPYTQFMISRLTLALQVLAGKLSMYMYDKTIRQLGLRETFILVAIFGYFTLMIVMVIPVIFIFSTVEGWNALTGIVFQTYFFYFLGIYFWVVTLTTIGFGDLTPNFSQDSSTTSLVVYYRWMIVLFKFIGLAYIAFLFEIMNIGLEKMFLYQQNTDNDGTTVSVRFWLR